MAFSNPIHFFWTYKGLEPNWCIQDILSHSVLTAVLWQLSKTRYVEPWHLKKALGKATHATGKLILAVTDFTFNSCKPGKSKIKNLWWLASMFNKESWKKNVFSWKTNRQPVKKAPGSPVSKNDLPHLPFPQLGWLRTR